MSALFASQATLAMFELPIRALATLSARRVGAFPRRRCVRLVLFSSGRGASANPCRPNVVGTLARVRRLRPTALCWMQERRFGPRDRIVPNTIDRWERERQELC